MHRIGQEMHVSHSLAPCLYLAEACVRQTVQIKVWISISAHTLCGRARTPMHKQRSTCLNQIHVDVCTSNLEELVLELKWLDIRCYFSNTFLEKILTKRLLHGEVPNNSKAVNFFPSTTIPKLDMKLYQHDQGELVLPQTWLSNHHMPQTPYCINYPDTLAFTAFLMKLEDPRGYFCILLK